MKKKTNPQIHKINFQVDLVKETLPPVPLKSELHLHWLAVNGCQPLTAENPSPLSIQAEDIPTALPKEMQVRSR